MTKQDALDILSTKYTTVLSVTEKQEPNVLLCTANCLDIQGDTATRTNVGFYVFDAGMPGEAAYWMRSEPKPAPVTTFLQEVIAFLSSKVADSIVLFYSNISVLPEEERATANVVLDVAAVLTEYRIAIWKDLASQFQYQIIELG